MDMLEEAPVAQMMPSMDDVGALIGGMKHNLAKVPQAGSRMMRPNMPTEFSTQGTAAMRGLQQAEDPFAREQVTRYLSKMR